MANPEEKRQKIALDKLNNEYTIKFSMKDLIFIYNVLCSQSYKVGDGKICWDIVQKIQPIVAVDTNIPDKPKDEGVLVDHKEDSN